MNHDDQYCQIAYTSTTKKTVGIDSGDLILIEKIENVPSLASGEMPTKTESNRKPLATIKARRLFK